MPGAFYQVQLYLYLRCQMFLDTCIIFDMALEPRNWHMEPGTWNTELL